MANEWQDPQQGQQSWDGAWVWDGRQWQPTGRAPMKYGGHAMVTDEMQRHAAIAGEPLPAPQRSVSKTRRSTSHTFHLIMTILTAGLWGLCVWLPVTLWHKFGPRRRTVTRSR